MGDFFEEYEELKKLQSFRTKITIFLEFVVSGNVFFFLFLFLLTTGEAHWIVSPHCGRSLTRCWDSSYSGHVTATVLPGSFLLCLLTTRSHLEVLTWFHFTSALSAHRKCCNIPSGLTLYDPQTEAVLGRIGRGKVKFWINLKAKMRVITFLQNFDDYRKQSAFPWFKRLLCLRLLQVFKQTHNLRWSAT